jgi:single-strand DNA-binding protein
MAQGEYPITLIGNLTADPELRFIPSGDAVANFTVATNPRTFDKRSNEWVDGDPMFMRCNVWRRMAENVAESLTRGQRVIVYGRLRQRKFTPRDADREVTVTECEVDGIGPDLAWAVTRSRKDGRGGGQGGGQRGGQGRDDGEQWASQRQQGGGQQRRQQPPRDEQRYDDPWGSAPPAGSGGGWQDDEPPF